MDEFFYLSVEQAALFIGVTGVRVRQLIHDGQILYESEKGPNGRNTYSIPWSAVKVEMDKRKDRKVKRRRLERTNKVLDYVKEFKIAYDGNSPSIRMIQDALGIPSTSSVVYHLDILEVEGEVTRGPGGLEVTGGRWSYNPDHN